MTAIRAVSIESCRAWPFIHSNAVQQSSGDTGNGVSGASHQSTESAAPFARRNEKGTVFHTLRSTQKAHMEHSWPGALFLPLLLFPKVKDSHIVLIICPSIEGNQFDVAWDLSQGCSLVVKDLQVCSCGIDVVKCGALCLPKGFQRWLCQSIRTSVANY